ncbi:phosphoenolpyruvate--protein phosphotransferase [Patulibacter sp.]|uniref:phosphoenolpyruvate--protein phosphotransferase n=1 Tax=Patulibacter sp. TaxID=1912859 RepID=UPI002729340B|nr:putative PEP-binding protein [Patulibacter sp.]MDO9408121.1 putative PEP-binding protein [Patulibacter sp.]
MAAQTSPRSTDADTAPASSGEQATPAVAGASGAAPSVGGQGTTPTAATALQGVGVCAGVALGPVARLGLPAAVPAQLPAPEDVTAEAARVRQALADAGDALDGRAAAAREHGRDEAAQILDAQAMMARDFVLADRAAALVTEGNAGPHAVATALQGFRAQLEAAGGYLAERAADLDGVRDRVVSTLLGVPLPGLPDPGHPYVLVAEDLTPADTATLDKDAVLGIVTAAGGATSHTAIIAKSLGIPAVVGCRGADALVDGAHVLVDGTDGAVLTDPADDVVARRREAFDARRALAAAHSGPGRTKDGHGVKLLVNLGAGEDPATAAAGDVEGVGLLRTELLYLDRATAPTFDEQTAAYRDVFAAFAGRKVVVRTLDAGADKPLPFLTDPDEPNPALGVRGYRTSWRHPDLLDDQLRAIAAAVAAVEAEAATGGTGAADADTGEDGTPAGAADVWVMAPMIATPIEAAAFSAAAKGHGLRTVGTMVEVPAAALAADALVAACDFVSIGTNDLSQYTFAADRLQSELAGLLDPWQPALLRLIQMVGAAGGAQDTPVGVCGEAAGDPLLAPVLVGLGVTSLSMASSSVADVRAALAVRTLEECRSLAATALAAADAAGARAAVAEAVLAG